MRALRAEVGDNVPLEAVLAAAGGEHHPGEARWRGRAGTIAVLREQLRAAQVNSHLSKIDVVAVTSLAILCVAFAAVRVRESVREV